MKDTLNPKQEAFVQEFMIDHCATQAAIRAGYRPLNAGSYASQLLRMPKVQDALAKLKADRVRRTQIDQDFVIEKLVENIERAMQAVPVLDRKGQPTGVYRYEGHVVNEALRMLAKHTGGFNNDGREDKNVTIIVDTGVPGPPGSSRMTSGATSSRRNL
jgi:phage terminase small subunit